MPAPHVPSPDARAVRDVNDDLDSAAQLGGGERVADCAPYMESAQGEISAPPPAVPQLRDSHTPPCGIGGF